MKIEFFLLIILIPILLNMYYDGKIFMIFNKFNFKSYEKYYKMAFVIFIFFCIYIYTKKNPQNNKDIIKYASNYVKYLPVDRNTTKYIQPFINMASISNNNNNNMQNYNLTPQQSKILTSGGKSTKRSVSETKKKYVASQQNWKCKHCKCQLPAWFEVDHVQKLEYGGSNSIDNLEALCRNCHGKKTAMENL